MKRQMTPERLEEIRQKFNGYIPTPLRSKLGLRIPVLKMSGSLWDRVDVSGGNAACWLWTGPVDRYGYGVYSRKGRAHRLAWEHHNGRELSAEEVVRHSCDNPRCCNPAHLFAGTQIENIDDRVQKGRSAQGQKNGRAKLTATEARAIYKSGVSVSEMARRYGIDESTVRGIRTGKTWAWATKDIPK